MNKKRTQATIYKPIATSKTEIRTNTFYKVSNLSDNNDVWNYYRILKPEIKAKDIGIVNKLKSSITSKIIKRKPPPDNSWKGPKCYGFQKTYKNILMKF